MGRNQATGIPAALVTHKRFLDALFNRNGESCRGLYERARQHQGKTSSSRARANTDLLVEALRSRGVEHVLETNVVCYSTPMSVGLRQPQHRGGASRGTELFRTLFDELRPSILIAHGVATVGVLGSMLATSLPRPTGHALAKVVGHEVSNLGCVVYVLPSLAPPAWNRWSSRAPAYFEQLASEVSRRLSGLSSRDVTLRRTRGIPQ